MSDASQRTEKPTPQKLEKARKEGRFAVSREALSATTFTVSIWLIISYLPAWLADMEKLWRFLLQQAFASDLSWRGALRLWEMIITQNFLPLLAAGAGVAIAGLGIQMAMTGFGFAGSKLAPDFSRLNPLPKIKEMPSQNMGQLMQALAMLTIFGAVVWVQMSGWIPSLVRLPLQQLPTALREIAETVQDLLKKAILVFALLGAADFIRQKMKFDKEMRMSKQEIRDEIKESEGSPQMKQRIRRLQRDAARRRMMQEVPKATAVIVNPTHYAVAIRFDMQAMAAPVVVAKGKNYLARRIREIAIANEVPIVENPPLARSLYKSVDVGREIPATLYRAVAEILAYIFRLSQAQRGPRRSR
jgi:flagellar biosynthetic protein FlhB